MDIKACLWTVAISLMVLSRAAVCGAAPEQAAEPARSERYTSGDAPMKLSVRIHGNPTDEYLLFLRQIGLSHVDVVLTSGGYDRETLEGIVTRLRDHGFAVGSVNNHIFWARKSDPIILGTEGREELMEEYLQFLRDASAVGFKAELISWGPSKVSRGESHRENETTRGAQSVGRSYDPKKSEGLAYGRRYTEEEMWDNFAWWAERAMPVAEEAGISLGVHPNLGIPEADGVPNLFHSRACYEKAIRIADSPRFGLTFCVGAWATNPDTYGDPVEAIRYFGKRNRIFHVHYRNLSSPLPRYTETFPDNGYVDMHEVMKALYEVGYDGTVIADHSPVLVTDKDVPHGGVGIGPGTGRAYVVAYMRAVMMALEKGWGRE